MQHFINISSCLWPMKMILLPYQAKTDSIGTKHHNWGTFEKMCSSIISPVEGERGSATIFYFPVLKCVYFIKHLLTEDNLKAENMFWKTFNSLICLKNI